MVEFSPPPILIYGAWNVDGDWKCGVRGTQEKVPVRKENAFGRTKAALLGDFGADTPRLEAVCGQGGF